MNAVYASVPDITQHKFIMMFSEFKKFAMRGNVVDLAVGVVIGAAFGKIVTSLVNDIIMPPIGVLTGGIDFSALNIVLKAATADQAAITINYGVFLSNIIDFLIVAFSIFFVIKQMNKLKKLPPAAEPHTKSCPECTSDIPKAATRCPHCTAVVA